MGKQNDKLIKNLREYDEKKKAKQHKSKVHGQKQRKKTNNT
jgi:hypothetical protein